MGALYLLSIGAFMTANYFAGDNAWWQMILNSLILSIPLILLYFSIGLILIARNQHKSQGHLDNKLQKIIYKTPRIAGLLIIFFITLFSLDVFEPGLSILTMIGAFIMHSIPSIFLAIFLYFAWKNPKVGFYMFLIGSLPFLLRFILSPIQGFGVLLLFAGPLTAISTLFWINWKWFKK